MWDVCKDDRHSAIEIMQHKEKILKFLETFLSLENLSYDLSLFENGLVNSLFSMQLILFLEESCDIKVLNEDITPDNFNTINRIMQFVDGKLK